jgi:hydroxylamine reductase
MFCFQCQETGHGKGCTSGGACGKTEETANYQDLLIYVLKGIALKAEARLARGEPLERALGEFLYRALFTTITNTNFDTPRIAALIHEGLALKRRLGPAITADGPDAWDTADSTEIRLQAYSVGVLNARDETIRSLRETVTYALKGFSAYAHHAAAIGYYDPALAQFIVKALAATTRALPVADLFALALEAGHVTLRTMNLLDEANAAVYGTPGSVTFPLSAGRRPGILVSGHDLKDLEELLLQSADQGIDIYTHGEMISAHSYPRLRAHRQLYGNYGNSWWKQDVEFAAFNGPILMTSNCIIPVADAYRSRIFTTGVAGYPGVPHLDRRRPDGQKDFSEIIALAKRCPPPDTLETGALTGGFSFPQLAALRDRLLELVRAGKIRRFIVMAGCDGRDRLRDYYRQVALRLPLDTLILTAGCTKYMFCKLPLGEIDGLPRVLDAGQCNDCNALIRFALHLKETLGLEDINALPISYDIAWYDQKAVAIFLALLSLGVKKIRLGPTLPAFLAHPVLETLAAQFQVMPIGSAADDVAAMLRCE